MISLFFEGKFFELWTNQWHLWNDMNAEQKKKIVSRHSSLREGHVIIAFRMNNKEKCLNHSNETAHCIYLDMFTVFFYHSKGGLCVYSLRNENWHNFRGTIRNLQKCKNSGQFLWCMMLKWWHGIDWHLTMQTMWKCAWFHDSHIDNRIWEQKKKRIIFKQENRMRKKYTQTQFSWLADEDDATFIYS